MTYFDPSFSFQDFIDDRSDKGINLKLSSNKQSKASYQTTTCGEELKQSRFEQEREIRTKRDALLIENMKSTLQRLHNTEQRTIKAMQYRPIKIIPLPKATAKKFR